MRWSIFICGCGLLCLASWIDNLRGPLLPVITSLMRLDFSAAGIIMALGNLVAMTTTWLLMPLLNRWSLKQVGIAVLIYTTVICAATAVVDTSAKMFLWGALIGGSISTLGSLSNLFVQSGILPERRGQLMSALHSLYGLSSFFAPWMAGVVLTEPANWSRLFTGVAPVSAAVALYIYKHGPEPAAKSSAAAQPIALERVHVLAVCVTIAYVVSEVLTSTWLSSYLIKAHGLGIKDAAFYTSMFFATMLATRVACGIFARPRWHRFIMIGSMVAAFICFVTASLTGWVWLFPFTGLFGPVFPLYVTWASIKFPDRDRSLVIWMLSGMQAALCVMNFVMGYLADAVGFNNAFWLPAFLMATTLLLLIHQTKDSSVGLTRASH